MLNHLLVLYFATGWQVLAVQEDLPQGEYSVTDGFGNDLPSARDQASTPTSGISDCGVSGTRTLTYLQEATATRTVTETTIPTDCSNKQCPKATYTVTVDVTETVTVTATPTPEVYTMKDYVDMIETVTVTVTAAPTDCSTRAP